MKLLFWNIYFLPPRPLPLSVLPDITDRAKESDPVFIKEFGYILNSYRGY